MIVERSRKFPIACSTLASAVLLYQPNFGGSNNLELYDQSIFFETFDLVVLSFYMISIGIKRIHVDTLSANSISSK